ncbi:MAG: hypothetical protein QG602_3458 [Verrucomicrobiota bacterium]|nr:hypothetical protein [Verrucomicrobiota bacterium]
MLARIIKPLPNAIIEQAKAKGVTSLANLLQVPPDAVVWTEDTMGPVIDFLAEVPETKEVPDLAKEGATKVVEKVDADFVTEVEAQHGAVACIAIKKPDGMAYAKAPPAGFVFKHEYGGLEVKAKEPAPIEVEPVVKP